MLGGFFLSRPFLIMALAIPMRQIVPAVARSVGNEDPDMHSMSHLLGQESVCSAMDFKGWMEAAGAAFIVAGLLDMLGLYQTHRTCIGDPAEGKPLKRCTDLTVFLCLEAFLVASAMLVTAATLISHIDESYNVLVHSIPYVVHQVSRWLFDVFLLVRLPPADVSRTLMFTWYCLTVFSVSWYFLGVSRIVATYIEMEAKGMDMGMEMDMGMGHGGAHRRLQEQHVFPMERLDALKLNEFALGVAHWVVLLLHPLAWRGAGVVPFKVVATAPDESQQV